MFYFIRKKIVVDCFINYPLIQENYPIRKAIKSSPTWWKNLPPTFEELDNFLNIKSTYPTMKTCPGFTDLFTQSWVYPLWADYQVKTTDTGNFMWKSPADFCPGIMSHPEQQYQNCFNEYIHLKLKSPWLFFVKTGINFAFIGNDWDLLKSAPQLRILPGILNFKNNHTPNVNFFLPRANTSHQLFAGLPFVHLIPLTEKRVEFRTHCLTDSEMREKQKFDNMFRTHTPKCRLSKTTL